MVIMRSCCYEPKALHGILNSVVRNSVYKAALFHLPPQLLMSVRGFPPPPKKKQCGEVCYGELMEEELNHPPLTISRLNSDLKDQAHSAPSKAAQDFTFLLLFPETAWEIC